MTLWQRLGGTLQNLWATTKGKVTIITVGLLIVALVAGIAILTIPRTNQPGGNPLALPTGSPNGTGTTGSDLFDPLPPTDPTAPPIADNGQVDIGGPGMKANAEDPVFGNGPIAEPDPTTGLMPMPSKVPWSQLVVSPNLKLYDAQTCASSFVPQSRAIANQTLAYLFTWDSAKASWADFIDPLKELWFETTVDGTFAGGNPGPVKYYHDTTWESRLDSLGYSERQWEAWAKAGVSSRVEVDQVLTLGPAFNNGVLPWAVGVQYLVTLTRTAPGVQAQTKQETVRVDVFAPCKAFSSLPPYTSSVPYLQAGDWFVVKE